MQFDVLPGVVFIHMFCMLQLFIDVLARVMCMRNELLPDGDLHRKPSSRSSHTDGSVTFKDGKHKRKVKCPEMKYNKFQMYNMRGENSSERPSSTHGNCLDSGATSGTAGDKSPVHFHQSIENDVREIRRYLRQLLGRIHQKEDRAKIALEWKIVALVLDRLFFFCYLAAIIISLATIFPKTY